MSSPSPSTTARRKFVYFAHPLRAADEVATQVNRQMAALLVARIVKDQERNGTPIVPMCAWIHLAEVWSEADGRGLGLVIGRAQIERCDELWLIGPRVAPSSGMIKEQHHALSVNVPVVDKRGYYP